MGARMIPPAAPTAAEIMNEAMAMRDTLMPMSAAALGS